jgi:hypothetical protein
VALTSWCLYSTITLHCTWLHLQQACPSVLHLQFDNCSCEKKNKYMLAYCHWLVFNKVFRSITISFLPVGHTHEDIDQMFSTFVIGMKYNPRVLTVEAFIQGLQDWYSAPHLRPEPYSCLSVGQSSHGWTPTSVVFRAPPGLMYSASPAMKLMCRCSPRTTTHPAPLDGSLLLPQHLPY